MENQLTVYEKAAEAQDHGETDPRSHSEGMVRVGQNPASTASLIRSLFLTPAFSWG